MWEAPNPVKSKPGRLLIDGIVDSSFQTVEEDGENEENEEEMNSSISDVEQEDGEEEDEQSGG